MNITSGFDVKAVEDIARNCGARSVKGSIQYLRLPFYRGGNSFICEVFDGVAFFAGTMCKKHFRLYEMAVKTEVQKKGYGKIMVIRMKQLCKKKGAEKITLRTSKEETAIEFYKKVGGRITGEKDNDYEVEITV